MKKIITSILFGALPFFVAAQKASESHCAQGEKTILNAGMGTGDSSAFRPNGKTLSICADDHKEPIWKIIYRYGRIGAAELEHVGTPQSKINVDSGYLPKTPISIFWFQKGNFIYAIKEFSGMENLLSLEVYRGQSMIAKLSAHEFESNTSDIDFGKPRSPALAYKRLPFPHD